MTIPKKSLALPLCVFALIAVVLLVVVVAAVVCLLTLFTVNIQSK